MGLVSIEELHGCTGCLRCCPSAGYNISLCILEGASNSPDIWNAVNGLNQQGYEGALGAATTHQTQPGSYSSLQPPHSHLVRFTSRTLDVDNTALLFPPSPVYLTVGFCLWFRNTPHIRWWPLIWTAASHPCPRFTATTRPHARRRSTPQRIQQVRKLRTYSFAALPPLPFFIIRFYDDCCFPPHQSQAVRETCQEGHRQALPWAKLWPL